MPRLTIHLPETLNAWLQERVKHSGAPSKEVYLLNLLEADCALGGLEQVLGERMDGPFEVLEPDWKERVRNAASTAEEP